MGAGREHPDFARYVAACDYPGVIDPQAVTEHLRAYCDALGITREIVRIERGWRLDDYPALAKSVDEVIMSIPTPSSAASAAHAALDALDALDALAARDARAARAAIDALDARAALAARDARDALDARDARAAIDALDARAALAARDARDALDALDARAASVSRDRFARWCINRSGLWFLWWEMSWVASTHIGAIERHLDLPWAQHVFEAYIAGAWLLYWTDSTLYWVAKPHVHVEIVRGQRRLHSATGAAIESDFENLYFWHGVLVNAMIVERPELITVDSIEAEENAEVKRVMIERYGHERYVTDAGLERIHADDYGTLYQRGEYTVVRVVDIARNPDGSEKVHWLPVDPNLRPLPDPDDENSAFGEPQALTARNAVASTFGMRGEEYTLAWEA